MPVSPCIGHLCNWGPVTYSFAQTTHFRLGPIVAPCVKTKGMIFILTVPVFYHTVVWLESDLSIK